MTFDATVTVLRPFTSLWGMTTSTTISSRLVPLDRPDWLTRDVWPFPTAAIEVDDHRVAYTDTGGDGPVLLFCHVGMWSLVWRDVMIEMSKDYRCVTFDTPGVGLSSRIAGSDQTLTTAARATGALIDALDLRNVVLVIHDLGGLAALAAANDRLDRINGLAVINSFAWRPRGVHAAGRPSHLRLGTRARVQRVHGLATASGSSTRFGVGRHMSKATRCAWRAGLADRSARRVPHRLFADAARNREVQRDAEATIAALDDRALLTVFGQLGDYLRFQRQWRQRRPDLTQRGDQAGSALPNV